jgi:hypothetical protein
MRCVEHADLGWSANVPEVDMGSPFLGERQRARLAADSDCIDIGKVLDSWHVLLDDRWCSDDGVATLETLGPGLEAAASDVKSTAVHHGTQDLPGTCWQ